MPEAVRALSPQASSPQASSPPPGGRPPVPGAHAGVTALVDLTVIPMDSERVLPRQTVLVQNGWITAMGPASQVRVPAGATRIDGEGKFLIPGLGDCHAHMGGLPFGGDPGMPPDSVAPRRLFQWLADGVTTIRNLDYMDRGKHWLLDGRDALQLRTRAAAGENGILPPPAAVAGGVVPRAS